jgi:hypothetical protein
VQGTAVRLDGMRSRGWKRKGQAGRGRKGEAGRGGERRGAGGRGGGRLCDICTHLDTINYINTYVYYILYICVLYTIYVCTHLGSSGCSAMFFTKVSSSFNALPPSPPVRYFRMVAMAESTFCAGSIERVAAEAEAGAGFLAAGAIFVAAGSVVAASEERFAGTAGACVCVCV